MSRIKLDENISRHLKPELQKHGHDVLTAADENLLGESDEAIAEAARNEKRILFTLDLEFADLRQYSPGTHPGIVLFRPRDFGPRSVTLFILTVMEQIHLTDLSGCVVVVEPHRIRIRKPQ